MSRPILVTGAAGGAQGSTGRQVTSLLLEQGFPVRALVHKLDARSDDLRKRGAEVIEGDLLNPASVRASLRDVRRAYFTYPVTEGLRRGGLIADDDVVPVDDCGGRHVFHLESFFSRHEALTVLIHKERIPAKIAATSVRMSRSERSTVLR